MEKNNISFHAQSSYGGPPAPVVHQGQRRAHVQVMVRIRWTNYERENKSFSDVNTFGVLVSRVIPASWRLPVSPGLSLFYLLPGLSCLQLPRFIDDPHYPSFFDVEPIPWCISDVYLVLMYYSYVFAHFLLSPSQGWQLMHVWCIGVVYFLTILMNYIFRCFILVSLSMFYRCLTLPMFSWFLIFPDISVWMSSLVYWCWAPAPGVSGVVPPSSGGFMIRWSHLSCAPSLPLFRLIFPSEQLHEGRWA